MRAAVAALSRASVRRSQRHIQRSPPAWRHTLRHCAGAQASTASAHAGDSDAKVLWDITPQKWVDVQFDETDYKRFPEERARFRSDPRLQPDSFDIQHGTDDVDIITAIKSIPSVLSIGDFYTEPFDDLLMERLEPENTADLLERFNVPAIEDSQILQPLHQKEVPKEGAYERVRMQVYWLALHGWLLHSKQHILQEGEGLFGSALCSSITRRVFEWQWSRIRLWLHAADVPIMAITGELQDLQEYIFGMCVALDDCFKEELGPATSTAEAILMTDEQSTGGGHGLGPRVKYALWANMYSGRIPHDAPYLYELTVYLLRQRIALEQLSRGSFLTGRFQWAGFPSA